MKNKIILAAMAAFALAGCWHEPELTPSTEPESAQYQLPQGTHDYDTRIMEFFEEVGTAMVYKFNESDLYYTGRAPHPHAIVLKRKGHEDNTDFQLDSVSQNPNGVGRYLFPADEAYIGRQLDLIDELLFSFYTKEQLFKLLPPTVYLANIWAQIDQTTWQGLPRAPMISVLPADFGPTSMTFSFGGPRLDELTYAEKVFAKKNMHRTFLKQAADKGIIVRSNEFLSISHYATSQLGPRTPDNGILASQFPNGSFGYYWYLNGNRTLNENLVSLPATNYMIEDWDSYVTWIVSTTEAEREDGTHARGYLHSSKDVNGLVRAKYDIMVRYMLDNYGIDLVKIGNTPVAM